LFSWLTNRLDRIAVTVDQINREGSKASDAGRDQSLLSLRDAVSLLGTTTAHLEESISAGLLAGDPAWRYRDAVIVRAIDQLPAASVVGVVADSSANELVRMIQSLGYRVIVVHALAADAIQELAPVPAALVVVGTDELARLWDGSVGTINVGEPARAVFGFALSERDDDSDELLSRAVARFGWSAKAVAELTAQRVGRDIDGETSQGRVVTSTFAR